MIYTYALLIAMIMASLFLAVIWEGKSFLNFTIKLGWFSACLLGIQVMFTVSGEVEQSFIEAGTYFWFSAVLWSAAALTWSKKGWLNLFVKFLTTAVALGCWCWIILN